MSFTIVEFEDKGVEYIPTRWLSGDSYCLCPPATKDFSSFRKILALPGKDWQRYKCVQLSTTSEEKVARRRVQRAVDGYKRLTSDDEPLRKRQRPDFTKVAEKKKMKFKECVHPLNEAINETFENSSRTSQSDSETAHNSLLTDEEDEGGSSRVLESSKVISGQDLTPFEKQVLLEMASMKANQNELMETVNLIARAVSALATEKGVALNLPVVLPIRSVQDINRMEKWLSNIDNMTNFTSQLSFIGGNSLNAKSRRLLKKIFCDELVCDFTFTGKNEKKSFRETCLYTACKQALKSQDSFTEHDIELSFQAVLKHAKDSNRSHKKKA